MTLHRSTLLALSALLSACSEDALRGALDLPSDTTSTTPAESTDSDLATATSTDTATEEPCPPTAGTALELPLSELQLVLTMRDAERVVLDDDGDESLPVDQGPGGVDAVSLARPEGLTDGSHWSIDAVDVLVAIPENELTAYPADVRLRLRLYEVELPLGATPDVLPPPVVREVAQAEQVLTPEAPELLETWSAPQQVRIGERPMEGDGIPLGGLCRDDSDCGDAGYCDADYDEENPEFGGCFPSQQVQTRWWRFDLTGLTPREVSQRAALYLVGVEWLDDARPLLGSSRFVNACNRNWTDTRDGKGLLPVIDPRIPVDDKTPYANECNWPMLRVHALTAPPDGSCGN